MSSAWNKFYIAAADLGNKIHDLGSDSLNFLLVNVAPTTASTVYSSFTDLSTADGYTAGGQTVGSTAFSETGGLATLTGSNVIWTATGSLGPFRYTPLYNDTASGKNALGYYDYGSGVTLSAGETLTINISSGIFTIQ
jgi:hypothetical protein